MLADRIRERREGLEMTQEELASHISKNQKQIWQYETGRTQPTASVLVELAMALNTTADYLLGLTDNSERPLRNAQDLSELERELIQHLRSKPSGASRKLLEFIEELQGVGG